MIYECLGDVELKVEAQSEDDAAGEYAVKCAGLDCDEICDDPFSFTINDIEYNAEVINKHKVRITRGDSSWFVDDTGFRLD